MLLSGGNNVLSCILAINGVAFTISPRARRLNVTFQKWGSGGAFGLAEWLRSSILAPTATFSFRFAPAATLSFRTTHSSQESNDEEQGLPGSGTPVYSSLRCQIIGQGTENF